MKRVGFMFAGQGAQAVGMGKDLVQESSAARAVFDRADAVLGRSVSDLCFEGPADALTASRNCQPAIYTMSLACLAALRERADIQPVVCAGLSLGEFAAVTCAGALDLEPGLLLVAERGRLMDEACRQTDGAMAAVIGAQTTCVEAACALNGVDVANFNCPGQLVISGVRDAIERTVAALGETSGVRVVMLDVAGAYHSRLMQPAADAFAAVLAETALAAPICPVAQNVAGACVSTPDALRANLGAQVTGSVRWEACVAAMMAQGVDLLIELGPGKVLSGFMRRIDRRFPVVNVAAYADLDHVVGCL